MQTTNTRLLLPEYGRNVQRMVRYLKTIDDREQRNRQAEVVVGIMGNLYPYKRDTEEFAHMLWDHLFMIADFELDIDCPFEKPTASQFTPVPSRVPYTQGYISQKHYGSSVAQMLRSVASAAQSGDEQPQDIVSVASSIAKYMKQRSFDYNKEYPSNEVVIADLNRLSGGSLSVEPDTLDNTQIIRPVK
ncbi:MAG: DUF4290 domain-containing protein, partial [Mucinivorans sp.]